MPEATLDSPQEAPEAPQSDVEALDGAGTPTDELEAPEEPQTFDRDYVEKLRQEAAEHRVKAKRADYLAQQLVTAYVSETGRLHDPSDLPYSDDLLEDGIPDRAKVEGAVEALVTAKPHLAKIRVTGDVGQGVQGQSDTMPSLGSMLKQAAG